MLNRHQHLLTKRDPQMGTFLAHSVEHVTLKLGVGSLSPRMAVEITLKKKKKRKDPHRYIDPPGNMKGMT